MRLTEEQRENAVNEILGKWRAGCVKCGGTNFNLFEDLYQLNPIQETGNSPGSKTIIPAVLVICENCGDLSLVNSVFLGITEGN